MDEDIEILTELYIQAKHEQGIRKDGTKEFKKACIDLHVGLDENITWVSKSFWVQGK